MARFKSRIPLKVRWPWVPLFVLCWLVSTAAEIVHAIVGLATLFAKQLTQKVAVRTLKQETSSK